MTETNREQLSSLMDGELERGARDFMVRRLAKDAELTGRWRRYHAIRACLQREFSGRESLCDRVSAALADEPAVQAEPRAGAGWLKPLGGVAVAASVAVAALVAINTTLLEQGQDDRLANEPGFVSQPTALDLPFAQPLVPVSFSETSPADRQRISSYVLRHNQAAGGSGVVSYVPIVAGARVAPVPAEAGTTDVGSRATEGVSPEQTGR